MAAMIRGYSQAEMKFGDPYCRELITVSLVIHWLDDWEFWIG